MRRHRATWTINAFLLLTVALSALGQSTITPCGVAPVAAANSQPNIFSDQQEIWLGEVESDIVESDIRPVRDASLAAHLQAIADRLVATLPPTAVKIRVVLVDSDEVNGFSLAGGHVYILRKLAALAKSDDELAGVLGHEIGHITSHQFAFETTREMKRLTNVTSVGDEADIRKKFLAMLDAEYHDKHPDLNESDREQAEADKIGLYAMASAGYDPKAYAEFWDRMFFVNGKTGNVFGDLLGLTKPSQKRLRSIQAMVAALSSGCGPGTKADEHDFVAWHKAVVANQAGAEEARSEALHEVKLKPPLRSELDQVRYSPDGKLILAQDDSSIFLLQRTPLSVRYRIDADDAFPAKFSPDSQSISFSTTGLHTEQWSTQEKKLLAAHEMYPRNPCYDTRLSPDGRTLLCVESIGDQLSLGLALIDTASDEVVWEKKSWLEPSYALARNLIISKEFGLTAPFFVSSYSEDNKVLLFAGGNEKIAFDLEQRTEIKTGNNIRDAITGEYAFLGNNKVAGINLFDHKQSGVYSFPDGKLLKKLPIALTSLASVTDPGANTHVLAYALKDYGVALADLPAGKLLASLKTSAMDEYDGEVVGESLGGMVSLAKLNNMDAKQQQHIALPLSPLARVTRTALSKDGRYLALSQRRRGGVWDLTTGAQIALVHGFTDATWADDDKLYMDIPKDENVERHILEFSVKERSGKSLPYKVTDDTHMRYGRLTDWKLDAKKKSWMLSLYDPATDAVIWSKSFPDRYFSYTASFGERDLIFDFELDSHTAKEALKANATLEAQAQAIKDKKSARLIKVLDGKNGQEDGSLVVELPPNFAGTDGLNRAGDLLYVQGMDDRTGVYSMATGKKLRDLIGYVWALDAETGKVFTANRIGEGVVYDADGKELAHYHLGDPIRFAMFLDAAKTVTVLTTDQTVRSMAVEKPTE